MKSFLGHSSISSLGKSTSTLLPPSTPTTTSAPPSDSDEMAPLEPLDTDRPASILDVVISTAASSNSELIEVFGAPSLRHLFERHPRTCHVVAWIPDDFLLDEFNHCNLHRFPHWVNHEGDSYQDGDCVEDRVVLPPATIKPLIGDLMAELDSEEAFEEELFEILSDRDHARHLGYLFTMLHQRYVHSKPGVAAIHEAGQKMFPAAHAWHCPRVFCNRHQLLPYGRHYEHGRSFLMGYCGLCRDIYDVGSVLDGALYGPSWCHFYELVYQARRPEEGPLSPVYEPRIYGFRTASRRASVRQ